jgi:hypothetical protein
MGGNKTNEELALWLRQIAVIQQHVAPLAIARASSMPTIGCGRSRSSSA